MIPVDPDVRTTLVLNKHYQSQGRFFTARAAIRHMMNGRVKGIDAVGNCVSWTGDEVREVEGYTSSLSWNDLTIELHPDQPCLRSAPNAITGLDTQWPVPTIVVCTHHFGYHASSGQSVSLKSVYRIYRGTCQYCLCKISVSEATKDHVFPKSLGGPNDSFNIVLACRSCNAKKDNQFPYYDANGREVKPRGMQNYLRGVPEGTVIREEWKQFLFIE